MTPAYYFCFAPPLYDFRPTLINKPLRIRVFHRADKNLAGKRGALEAMYVLSALINLTRNVVDFSLSV